MALPEAQKAYLLVKAGIVKGLSIGFEAVKDSVEAGIRYLSEIKLYEGSIVTFPMNEMALITSVKKRKEAKDDFNEELSDIQLMQAGWQMFGALQNSLNSIIWASNMDAAEKVAAASAYIQQFSDAYMGYLPAFLEMLDEEYGGMELMAARRTLELKAKPVTKKVDGVELTADCFAYVGDPEKTETWKLPIKFPGDDEKTKSHIRNALARFDQTQGIPDSERPAVLAKIRAAAKKYSIDVPDKGALFESKEGRMISATNQAYLKSALDHIDTMSDHMESVKDIISALVDDGAGDDGTAKAAAASTTPPKQAAETKSEPVIDHSAISSLLLQTKEFNGTRTQSAN